jgi:hypothetical protein
LHSRGLGDGNDPLGSLVRCTTVNETAHFDYVRIVFLDPVLAREATIEVAMLDVTTDFLGTHEATI